MDEVNESYNEINEVKPSNQKSSQGKHAENPEEVKAKKKKRRKKKRPLLKFLIFVAFLVGLYYFGTSSVFTVGKITVSGNQYYTVSQVKEMSGLNTGYNLFEMKLKPAKNQLLEDPYIRLADITRKIPDTVEITITERTEYAAVPYGADYIIIDAEGMVLRITADEPVLPLIDGIKNIQETTPGKPLKIEQSYLLTHTLDFLSKMEENDLYFKRVLFSAVVVKAYIYDDLYCEGTPENISANMPGIRKVVEELFADGNTRGVIKVGEDALTYSPNYEQ